MSELVFSKTLTRARKALYRLHRTLHFNAPIPSPSLLGPPEIYKPPPPPPPPSTAATEPFIDLMVSNFNSAAVAPPRGFTENNSATYLATGNPCLDFFFHVVPDTPAESIRERTRAAWDHDALTTMKLICNLRGVRGTGKSDKEGFYAAALWLHGLHPKTLAGNVGSVADFGYFKDLPEILYRILEGSEVRIRQREERDRKRRRNRRWDRETTPFEGRKKKRSPEDREIRIRNSEIRNKLEEDRAREARHEKYRAMAKKVLERYAHDPDFKYLHDRISDHFADRLKSDLAILSSGGKVNKISLAAKWCPSLYSSFDRSILLCESIARRIFDRESFPEYDGVEEAHYAYRIRDRLRKEVLVPLRKALQLPEVYIGAGDWKSLPYNRVASVAMELYKERFMKYDGERFAQYLADVKSGKTTIAAGARFPHQIIESAAYGGESGEVAELQWNRMVEDLLKLGKFKDCLPVCDVSSSMNGKPMEVSVSLGLLLSELSEEPWKGKIINFHQNPKLHLISGSDLHSKTSFIRSMEWGAYMNTDFQKVFDLILDVAVSGNLPPEKMIKRIFVFSDMEFDQASSSPWETDYDVIRRKFEERGYGSSVPEIVFWNLRDSKSTPVVARQRGVALVSGFSKNAMKMFLRNDGDIDPEMVMEAAISGPEYQDLVVLD